MENSRLLAKWLPYMLGLFGMLLIYSALLTMLIYRYDPGIPNANELPFLVSSALVGTAINKLLSSTDNLKSPLSGRGGKTYYFVNKFLHVRLHYPLSSSLNHQI